jgi:hypothetical protein
MRRHVPSGGVRLLKRPEGTAKPDATENVGELRQLAHWPMHCANNEAHECWAAYECAVEPRGGRVECARALALETW